jgi:hypothetical protein
VRAAVAHIVDRYRYAIPRDGGRQENAPDDMGSFVANCDRLRLSTGAHILVVHHSGKDNARGARGHSLLKAAADTEIAVEKNELSSVITATVAKQRDHRIGDPFAFRLIPVEVGTDENGEPVTSCVVEPETGTVVRTEAKRQRDPKAAQIALRALAEAVDEQGVIPPGSMHIPTGVKVVPVSVWRQQAYRRGISTSDEERAKQQAFKRASEYLNGVSRIGVCRFRISGEHGWRTTNTPKGVCSCSFAEHCRTMFANVRVRQKMFA